MQAELLTVHREEYLRKLRSAAYLAAALEVRQIQRIWWRITDWFVLRPMRWATAGTILAGRLAMQNGLAINLGGGFHHAHRNGGHGFCIYADISLAIDDLRRRGLLEPSDRVVYIDLDAHQGDGVCLDFYNDPRVFIYDQYNLSAFPMNAQARRRIDCDVPMDQGVDGKHYLEALGSRLPDFLCSICRSDPPKLAIYNAGSDIFEQDQLGGLNVSAQDVAARDRFVLDELVRRCIPTMVLLSGGYGNLSYQLVAKMAGEAVQKWGAGPLD